MEMSTQTLPVLGISSMVPAPSRTSIFQFTFSLTPNSGFKCLNSMSIEFGLTAKSREVKGSYGGGRISTKEGTSRLSVICRGKWENWGGRGFN